MVRRRAVAVKASPFGRPAAGLDSDKAVWACSSGSEWRGEPSGHRLRFDDQFPVDLRAT